MTSWLYSIHHDGSAQYVSDPYPRLGDRVRLRLRTSVDAPVRNIYLRTYPDGEQAFATMQPGPIEPPARWWEVDLPINEPLVHYRFIINAKDGLWHYTAAGPVIHEPTDATDFKILADYQPVDWLQNSVFYQIFPERFANGDPSNDPPDGAYEFHGYRSRTMGWEQPLPEGASSFFSFYGGDLAGIVQHLDYLQMLGVNALYLNPIFTAYTPHKYDVADYDNVDPHFGGNEALIALRRALDEHHMRYILDMVPNHCGLMHPWFQRAQADPNSVEHGFFTFTQYPDQWEGWMGHSLLPKLNYQSAELCRLMYEAQDSAFRKWLRPPYSADGWRVDVANMLGRQGAIQMGTEITRAIRRAVKTTRPDAYFMAENFHDGTVMLQGDQYDAVMNYMGFTTPLGHWLHGYEQKALNWKETITSALPYSTAALADTWHHRRAAIPWVINQQQYNLLGSHDTMRIRSLLGGNDALHRLATVLLMTFPGVPGLYYGDEIGMAEHPELKQRACMIWDQNRWNHSLLNFHRELIALRRGSPALQRGGFQMLLTAPDTLAYQRESNEGRVLVVAHRAEQPRPASTIDVAYGGIPNGTRFVEHFSGQEATVEDSKLALPEHPQGATLWTQRT